MKYSTNSYIGLHEFEPDVLADKKLFESLNGKFILIEGVFKAITRNSIDMNDDEMSICFRGCGTVGYIEQINRIDEWSL